MNAREMLDHVAHWLGWQDEDFNAKLHNAFDALRLYDYAQKHPNLPEMADEWEHNDLVAALGYNPWENEYYAEAHTGAVQAMDAMKGAVKLLDSVAYVTKEGDTGPVLMKLYQAGA